MSWAYSTCDAPSRVVRKPCSMGHAKWNQILVTVGGRPQCITDYSLSFSSKSIIVLQITPIYTHTDVGICAIEMFLENVEKTFRWYTPNIEVALQSMNWCNVYFAYVLHATMLERNLDLLKSFWSGNQCILLFPSLICHHILLFVHKTSSRAHQR